MTRALVTRVRLVVAIVVLVGSACGSGDEPPRSIAGPTSTADAENSDSATAASTTPVSHDHFPNYEFTGPEPAGTTEDGRFLTLVNTGAYLVTTEPYGTEPTAAQRTAAIDFGAEVIGTIRERYDDVDDALAEGFVHLPGDAMHYVSAERIIDDHHADPAEPESLMYHPDANGELVLLGAMFLEPEPTHGREVGGPATPWHYHVYEPDPRCVVASGFPVGEPDVAGDCVEGVIADRSPEMLHVWIWNPVSTFDGEVLTPTAEQLAEHFDELRE